MIDKVKADNLIQAWALGCLDLEEYEQMRSFLESETEFQQEQIGDYQNLVALLPLILEPVKPGVQAKDKLARKLYRIKEEMLAKKAEAERVKKEALEKEQELRRKEEEELRKATELVEPENDLSEQPIDTEINEKIPSVEDLVQKTESKDKVTEFEVVTSKRFRRDQNTETAKKTEEIPPVEEQKDQSETGSLNLLEIEKKHINGSDEQQSKKGTGKKFKEKEKPYRETSIFTPPSVQKQSKFPWVLMTAISAIILIVIFFNFFSVKDSLEEVRTNTALTNEKLDDLNSKLETDLVINEFLTGEYLGIVNLSGTNLYPSGNGKLLIDFNSGESILLLNNLPAAPDQRDYQLWVNVGGEYYSLKVFNVYPGSNHFTFSMPPLTEQYETRFIVTEENSGGSESPGRRIFLEGTFR